jgi:hypothetical protein
MSIWIQLGYCYNLVSVVVVGACRQIQDMYDKAMAAGLSLCRVAKVYAPRFLLMTDLYGDMPYTDA